jgi:hypothetical protein
MSKKVPLKDGEVVVSQNDFGLLVEDFVRNELRPGRNIEAKWMDEHIRKWWPLIEKYYQQHIISAIEVALALDEPPRYGREALNNKEMWAKIVKDLRPTRSPFTVKYHCSKCKKKNVKLWRDYQTFASHVELECAACLAPDVKVDDEGMWQEPGEHGMRTDQLKGKVPAIPVDSTYWGYTSVPSQDVEWWKQLPTYPPK